MGRASRERETPAGLWHRCCCDCYCYYRSTLRASANGWRHPTNRLPFLALSKRGPGSRMAYVSPSWKLLLRKVIRRYVSTCRSHVYCPCVSGLDDGG
ncbi:hypothetical protein CGRA01v4_02899 [Colletotrichum graminicola]|nr:hypothetical protein CGRA01v4_02899 [Colletotrichum graminicola]